MKTTFKPVKSAHLIVRCERSLRDKLALVAHLEDRETSYIVRLACCDFIARYKRRNKLRV